MGMEIVAGGGKYEGMKEQLTRPCLTFFPLHLIIPSVLGPEVTPRIS